MRFVGIDLHKRSLTVCVIDKQGGETFDRYFRTCEEARIRAFFSEVRPFQAVIEASATYEWLWELLEPLADRLVLAHPKNIRIIADSMKKSDRRDAFFLAWLLSEDAVPEAARPTPQQRDYQHYTRHRHHLVRASTRTKAQIRSLLSSANLDVPDLFTVRRKSYLAEIPLRPAERFRVDELTRLLASLEEQLQRANRALKDFRKHAPEAQRRNYDIATSVPGVGPLTADIVLSTLGDVRRFPSAETVASYAGLAPGYRQSDKRRHELPITKEGSRMLRWALVEAAWMAVRYSRRFEKVFENIAQRRGRKKAITAVARKLLVVIYSLLKRGEHYQEQPDLLRGLKLPGPSVRARPTRPLKAES